MMAKRRQNARGFAAENPASIRHSIRAILLLPSDRQEIQPKDFIMPRIGRQQSGDGPNSHPSAANAGLPPMTAGSMVMRSNSGNVMPNNLTPPWPIVNGHPRFTHSVESAVR